MRSGIYMAGLLSTIILLALAFQLLPSPWQGGAAGWFGAIWYLCALAAGLGYWYKYDQARDREARQHRLKQVRQQRQAVKEKKAGQRQQSY